MKIISYNVKNFRQIEYMKMLPETVKQEIEIVSKVLPFKANNYVVDYLIDWANYETDPCYILTFPNRHMLRQDDYEKIKWAVESGKSQEEITRIANSIRMSLNPHPAQQQSNIPTLNGQPLPGVQHKYRDIALFFPTQGQTCHANCTFCFRWPQFVKDLDLQFSMKEIGQVCDYFKQHEHLHELLFTGGDPMIMSPRTISKYIDTIFKADIKNLKTIRFGTKSLTWWPFVFLPQYNEEAQEMLDLFKRIVDKGIHLSIMAHFNHYQEMSNSAVAEAIENIRATGAEIRTQSPLLNNINASSEVWAKMWDQQVNMGMIPYYMFVERETGPFEYFQVPLAKAYKIYSDAIRVTSSLAKTVTGPSMSAAKGKAQIMGIIENPLNGEKYFQIQYIRHRDYKLSYKPFLTHYDENATWIDQLKPVESSFLKQTI
ncbi:lysine 2,3-aminomutase [Carboxylicivirga sp. N1Y132]|uniref:Lysine 2,3-aminomutase n=2 Tax=Carboxylicivirga marina TaxID=2800988 RepID=A0ABS1HK46_9BACT|nr:lysine 2,3-aminomutase [Carboxylicivirga marina]